MIEHDSERLVYRLLSAELRSTLKRWGDWLDRQLRISGLPKQTAFLNTPSTAAPGHRILCADMDTRVAALSRAIVRLEESHRTSLEVWYAHQFDSVGRWISPAQKASQMGIEYAEFRHKVYLARKSLLHPSARRYWVL